MKQNFVMADYISAYSGEQIDTAIGKILAGGGSRNFLLGVRL